MPGNMAQWVHKTFVLGRNGQPRFSEQVSLHDKPLKLRDAKVFAEE